MDGMNITIDPESLGGISSNPEIEDIPSSISKKVPTEMGAAPEEIKPVVVSTINSASYGGFIKILSMLTKNMGKMDIVNIEEGKVNTMTGMGHLYCDLSALFGKNNFSIIDPQYNMKLLKLISGGDEVTFIDDAFNSKYIISNLADGKTQSYIILKKSEDTQPTKITKPALGDSQEVLVNMDADLVGIITTAEKSLDSQFFIVDVIKTDEGPYSITAISTDREEFKFNFKDDINPDNVTKYKLFSPFPVDKPEEIRFELFLDPNDELWIKTYSLIGMADIEYSEKLVKVSEFHTFSLV